MGVLDFKEEEAVHVEMAKGVCATPCRDSETHRAPIPEAFPLPHPACILCRDL